nr:MAG TPA: hypothetical protein [Caudoviricetes sp.]
MRDLYSTLIYLVWKNLYPVYHHTGGNIIYNIFTIYQPRG